MLEVTKLYKHYDDHSVLNGISFRVKPGEIVSLLGGNGSGKTTTFKSILDLVDYEGRIRMNGRLVSREQTGYMPEERSMFHDCTIHRQLQFWGRLKGMNEDRLNRQLEWWYEKTGTDQYRNMTPARLSKGNQQKIQLIMAFLHDPQLVILDEPWTGLDQENIALFRRILLEMRARKKMILLSSHQHQQVQEICDRYLYLHQGEIILDISRDSLKQSPYCVIETSDPLPAVPGIRVVRSQGLNRLYLTYSRLPEVLSTLLEKGHMKGFTQRPLSISDLIELQLCSS